MRNDTLRSAHDEILRTLAEWREAMRAGDAEHLARLVSEDAEFWSQETPPLKGRPAVAATFRAFFESYATDQRFECEELLIADDWAFLRGTEVNTLTPRDGGAPIVVRQRAFSLLGRSDDGRWRFARGMTHRPPAADSGS